MAELADKLELEGKLRRRGDGRKLGSTGVGICAESEQLQRTWATRRGMQDPAVEVIENSSRLEMGPRLCFLWLTRKWLDVSFPIRRWRLPVVRKQGSGMGCGFATV